MPRPAFTATSQLVTSIRRDVRSSHILLLERWLKHDQSTEGKARIASTVRETRAEFDEYRKLEAASQREAELRDDLALHLSEWSERMLLALEQDEPQSSAQPLRDLLDRVTDDAEALLTLNPDAGNSHGNRIAAMQNRRMWFQMLFVAALMTLMAMASLLWRRQASMRQLYDLSEKANLDLRRMAASLAHEVNNQLAILQNTIALLYKDSRSSELLSVQQESVEQMKALTSDFLAFGQASSATREPVDLVSLIQSVAHSFSERVRVVAAEPAWVVADRAALSRVFLNLIKNGIESGENVAITVSSRDERIRVLCEDDGCGLPEDHLHLIGEPFFTTKPRGSGLGLATVRRIAEQHNAHFEVRNRKGQRGAVAEIVFMQN